jgi:hypothetical protein
MATGPVTIKLREPIQFGTQLVDELTLRKPKGKDFRRLPMDMKMGDLLDFAGVLANQPKAVIDELGVEDLAEVMNVVGGFIPGGRGIGTEPSP